VIVNLREIKDTKAQGFPQSTQGNVSVGERYGSGRNRKEERLYFRMNNAYENCGEKESSLLTGDQNSHLNGKHSKFPRILAEN